MCVISHHLQFHIQYHPQRNPLSSKYKARLSFQRVEIFFLHTAWSAASQVCSTSAWKKIDVFSCFVCEKMPTPFLATNHPPWFLLLPRCSEKSVSWIWGSSVSKKTRIPTWRSPKDGSMDWDASGAFEEGHLRWSKKDCWSWLSWLPKIPGCVFSKSPGDTSEKVEGVPSQAPGVHSTCQVVLLLVELGRSKVVSHQAVEWDSLLLFSCAN